MGVTALPIIGYDNLLVHSDGTPSGDGTNPSNAYDWLTHDAWTTGATDGYLRADMGAVSHTCDYYAVAGHDIFTQTGDCKLQYWTGAAYADVPGSAYTPVSNDVFVVCFEPRAALRFQFIVQNLDAAASIAVVAFGSRLDLPVGCKAGYRPARFSRQDRILNNLSQSGSFLGRSLIATGCAGRLNLEHMDEDWARIYLDPWVEATRTQGWFLLWDPLHRPSEAAYLWTKTTPEPEYEDVGLVSCTVDYEGITE